MAVKPICEDLGLSWQVQHRKLSSLPWAAITMMVIPSDGGPQDTFCVDVDTLLMWLATIHASKVKPAARAALIAYQRHVKKVIADYFLGRAPKYDQATIEQMIQDAVARATAPLIARLNEQARLYAAAHERGQQALVTRSYAMRRREELACVVDMIAGLDRRCYEWRHAYAAELRACFQSSTEGRLTRFTEMTWEQGGRAEQYILQRQRAETRRLRRTKAGRQRVADVRQKARRGAQTELFN